MKFKNKFIIYWFLNKINNKYNKSNKLYKKKIIMINNLEILLNKIINNNNKIKIMLKIYLILVKWKSIWNK